MLNMNGTRSGTVKLTRRVIAADREVKDKRDYKYAAG
jgi:hypothetical protein